MSFHGSTLTLEVYEIIDYPILGTLEHSLKNKSHAIQRDISWEHFATKKF